MKTNQEIKILVSSRYGITVQELERDTREQHICFPRQVAMTLMREEKRMSWWAVAHEFGMTHRTPIHAVATVHDRCDTEPAERARVEQLRREII